MRVLSLSLVVLLALAGNAAAQDRHDGHSSDGQWGNGHAENHDWYKELKQPGSGYSCCNGSVNGVSGDCRPTRAYLSDDGTWRALVNGRWTPVPPRVVLKRLAPDGNSHICAAQSGMIYCFIGGSPKS